MTELTWAQVTAWRLVQQHLLERAPSNKWLAVVRDLGGLHAQLMSAAELSLWARVENLPHSTLEDALWRGRTLVKTWAMRGTLHLLPVADFPLHTAARQATLPKRPPSWYTYHGVTPDEAGAIRTTVPQVLSDEPQTREALATTIAEQTGNPKLRDLLLSGWGALLKPSAFAGDLCFGPNQGQNVTFVRPDCWLGDWAAGEPHEAIREVARRFLRTYGPATLDEFARWWGAAPSQVRPVFKALSDEISEVSVEGWRAWALNSTLAEIEAVKIAPFVRLLPFFDPYTIAVARHSEHLLDDAYKGRVYRPQGWIAPVVLVNGRIEGVWEQEKQGNKVVVQVELFTAATSTLTSAIASEATRLGEFLGVEVEVVGA
ncbi:MAG: winged helix DNA-binding domain-containing protein [Chloroflexi bacterium]|nr:MAG: winged helix DNA-binding domain-containing protein [Chloroflexota bacterium]